jgi:hypothetical protein
MLRASIAIKLRKNLAPARQVGVHADSYFCSAAWHLTCA